MKLVTSTTNLNFSSEDKDQELQNV